MQVADVNKPTGSKNECRQTPCGYLIQQDYKVNGKTEKDSAL